MRRQVAPSSPTWRGWLWGALGVLLALLPVLLVTLGRDLNPDEHQFIASGALLARAGLLPYRDYAYFHVPNLTFVYGAIFKVAPALLLSARTFALTCSVLLLGTLLVVARRRWRAAGAPAADLGAALAVGGFALAPLYIYTSGRAWNHDLPALLTVWAALALVYGAARARGWAWVLAAGLCAGFAAGTRASFALALLPLAAAAARGGRGVRGAGARLAAFGAGAALGLAPVAWAAAQDPAAFLFGNLEYARLNTLYRTAAGFATAMTLPGKLALLGGQLILPGNLLIAAAYLAFGLPRRADWRSRPLGLRALVLLLLPFLLIGALAPTPAWPQYFYLLLPFVWLAALDGLAARPPAWWGGPPWGEWRLRRALLALLVLLLVLWGITNRRDLHATFTGKIFPIAYHRTGVEVAALLGAPARVLTLAPTLPLEGGLDVYPELTAGPFALRAATLVSSAQQAAYNLPPAGALDGWLAQNPPRAALLSVDRNDLADEAPLADLAAAHAYVPLQLHDKSTIWVNPLAAWGGNIRLAALTRTPAGNLAPGQTLSLLNYLQAQQPTASNLSRIVRLRGAAGDVAAQVSEWPWGRPTSGWQPGEIWYDGVQIAAPANAAPGLYRLEVEMYDADAGQTLPLALGTGRFGAESAYGEFLVIGEWPSAPAVPERDDLRLGGFARLLGYTLPAPQPDGAFAVRLFWQGLAPAATDYTVFAHLLDASGALVAQQDKPPLGGFYPTRAWEPNLTFADDFTFALPAPAPPGPYTLSLGFYNPATGERAPVTRNGRAAGDTVEIEGVGGQG